MGCRMLACFGFVQRKTDPRTSEVTRREQHSTALDTMSYANSYFHMRNLFPKHAVAVIHKVDACADLFRPLAHVWRFWQRNAAVLFRSYPTPRSGTHAGVHHAP